MTKNIITKKIILKLISIMIFFVICISNISAIEKPDLYAKAAILVDNASGKILFGKDENERVYPASTTKVLTAILALENLDLSKSTVISAEAVDLPYGSSNAALKQGEVMNNRDLLYAMMLVSGNDCANVLAEAVSGSIDKFVVLMNEKLKEIGCTNSHFTNAHGYHDDDHYTTPVDMMKLLSYAMKNEEFVKITSTSSYTIEATNKTDSKRVYQNTNRLILTKDDSYLSRYYEYCIGGKTGYTDEAGRTLVAYGTKDDKNLILGVFNVTSATATDLRYTDAINLFEYGFNNFEKSKLMNKSDYSFSYTNHDKNLKYNYSINEDILALSSSDEINSPTVINYDININYDELNKYDINSTDYKNQVIGSIKVNFRQNSYTYDKNFDLVLNSIEKTSILSGNNSFKNILKNIIYVLLIIFVLFVLLKIFTKISRNKKRKLKAANSRSRTNKTSKVNGINNLNFKSRRSRR